MVFSCIKFLAQNVFVSKPGKRKTGRSLFGWSEVLALSWCASNVLNVIKDIEKSILFNKRTSPNEKHECCLSVIRRG